MEGVGSGHLFQGSRKEGGKSHMDANKHVFLEDTKNIGCY